MKVVFFTYPFTCNSDIAIVYYKLAVCERKILKIVTNKTYCLHYFNLATIQFINNSANYSSSFVI